MSNGAKRRYMLKRVKFDLGVLHMIETISIYVSPYIKKYQENAIYHIIDVSISIDGRVVYRKYPYFSCRGGAWKKLQAMRLSII